MTLSRELQSSAARGASAMRSAVSIILGSSDSIARPRLRLRTELREELRRRGLQRSYNQGLIGSKLVISAPVLGSPGQWGNILVPHHEEEQQAGKIEGSIRIPGFCVNAWFCLLRFRYRRSSTAQSRGLGDFAPESLLRKRC